MARWIIAKARVKKPLKRLWISSVTDQAIKAGFNNLKAGRQYENLYASAVARSEADWYVGINATRALTCKHNAQLSCGRVQSPTLAIIAQREEEIKHFTPRTYYGITAITPQFKLIWQQGKSGNTTTFNQQKRDQTAQALANKDAQVVAVDKVDKKQYPPQLYDLTELQRDANKIYGYSARETLAIMQRLYEQHKLLTYPRTDSRYISTDIVDTLKDRLEACSVNPYGRVAARLLRQPIKARKSFVDNSKVSDHHAIIPTEQPVFLNQLSDKEKRIYDLVVKRFIAALYPPFQYQQTTIRAKIGDQDFIARGKRVLAPGWKEVYENNYHNEDGPEEGEQKLPSVNKGDVLKVGRIVETEGQTKPPAYLNEGTLLSAMENPARYMQAESKDLIKTIGRAGGIGTVATRADIIDKLFNSFLIEKKGQDILVTSKGKQLLDLVPAELKSPSLTAEWEQKLEAIARGDLAKDTFIKDVKAYARQVVKEIKDSQQKFKHDNITGNRCPQCNKFLLDVKGKRGKMLICQDRVCGYRKGISRTTNARCPQCRKRLELRGEGQGQIFVCRCGHREKLTAFNERRKKRGAHVSKGEVNQYLRQQKKQSDAPINSALADALAKFKQ